MSAPRPPLSFASWARADLERVAARSMRAAAMRGVDCEIEERAVSAFFNSENVTLRQIRIVADCIAEWNEDDARAFLLAALPAQAAEAQCRARHWATDTACVLPYQHLNGHHEAPGLAWPVQKRPASPMILRADPEGPAVPESILRAFEWPVSWRFDRGRHDPIYVAIVPGYGRVEARCDRLYGRWVLRAPRRPGDPFAPIVTIVEWGKEETP